MALKVVWTKRADRKFDQIITYLIDDWGENAAKDFVRKVFDFVDILAEYPEIGSLENKEKNIRGFTIVKQITLYYKVENDVIILLLFFDNRQHPKKKNY